MIIKIDNKITRKITKNQKMIKNSNMIQLIKSDTINKNGNCVKNK